MNRVYVIDNREKKVIDIVDFTVWVSGDIISKYRCYEHILQLSYEGIGWTQSINFLRAEGYV